MGGFEAIPDELRRAATVAKDAAQQTQRTDLAGIFAPASSALPGSTSEQAAVGLFDTWLREVPALATRMAERATNLDQCRTTYIHHDHSAAAGFVRASPDVTLPGFDDTSGGPSPTARRP